MAKKTVAELKQLSSHLFDLQRPVLNLWQTLAEHFYPERADFTVNRSVGSELADGLVDSYPVLVRRDLGNSLSSMLRDGEWYEIDVKGGETDHDGRRWLEWSTNRLMGMMNDRSSNFVRATKEGDHDYVTFGQPVLSVERNRHASGLLYRAWHLRDCAWFDGEDGQVAGVVRKWKPTRHGLIQEFGEKRVHPDIIRKYRDKPFERTDIRHFVLPTELYGDEQLEERFPYVSIYLDMTHEHIIEEVGINHRFYIIPRFQTVAGSPYAYSPATVVGLPDARTLQAMTHTLLEAAERYARPPLIAQQKVVRSDVDLSPDGITWLDMEYDEKTGLGLRPLMQDRGGFPIGIEMRQNIVQILSSAFYINKLSLPEVTREMTAYEVRERMKQFRRENLPLFAPIESEYNGQLCELSFEIALSNGMLGSPYDIPDSLKGRDVEFKFESPLSEAEEEKKAQLFNQTAQMLGEASQFDQTASLNLDFDTSLRDAIEGIGVPEKWLRSLEEVLGQREQIQQQQAVAALAPQGGANG